MRARHLSLGFYRHAQSCRRPAADLLQTCCELPQKKEKRAKKNQFAGHRRSSSAGGGLAALVRGTRPAQRAQQRGRTEFPPTLVPRPPAAAPRHAPGCRDAHASTPRHAPAIGGSFKVCGSGVGDEMRAGGRPLTLDSSAQLQQRAQLSCPREAPSGSCAPYGGRIRRAGKAVA